MLSGIAVSQRLKAIIRALLRLDERPKTPPARVLMETKYIPPISWVNMNFLLMLERIFLFASSVSNVL